jgi:ribosomal protein S7
MSILIGKYDVLSMVREVANVVTTDELMKLRLEEELLVSYARNPEVSIKEKKLAFERIAEINRQQLKILGN